MRGTRFCSRPRAFYQVNHAQGRASVCVCGGLRRSDRRGGPCLTSTAVRVRSRWRWPSTQKTAIGVGNRTGGHRKTPSATRSATAMENTEFFCADGGSGSAAAGQARLIDVLVVDPAAQGSGRDCTRCDPEDAAAQGRVMFRATRPRSPAMLRSCAAAGYTLEKAQAFDLFPEKLFMWRLVCLLQRRTM